MTGSRAAAAAVALVTLLAAPPGDATPRFAAQRGMPCAVCHVDPSGGGMRTAYGRSVFAASELALAGVELPEGASFLDAGITDSIAIGSDVRLLHYYREQPGNAALHENSFYLMEAALYVAADVWDVLTVYLAPMLHGTEYLVFEAAGIIRLPWVGLYAKIGRFTPVYGHKLPNHTHWIRQRLGLTMTDKDNGIEVGLLPGPFSLQVSVFAGAQTGLDWDDNDLVGVSARVAYIPHTRYFKAKIGHSVYYNIAGEGPGEAGDPDERVETFASGGFAAFSVGRFTLLAELDLVRVDDRTAPRPIGQLIWHHELSMMPLQGLELVASHELWDPDIDLLGDAVHRIGLGFDLFPWPYSELTVRYRYTVADPVHPWDDVHDLSTVFHFFF